MDKEEDSPFSGTSKKQKIIVILFTSISFFFIFGLISFRLLTRWELVLRRPRTEGWTFFFGLLIVGFFISTIFFNKKEIKTLFLSSFIAFFWEFIIEPFGWYFNLWPFAPHLDDPIEVFYLALQLGLEFYAFYYLLGMLYIVIYNSKFKYKFHVLITICFILSVLGWLGDLFIAKFETYVITFLVWTILNSLHLIGVIKLYNYFTKHKN